MDFPTGQNIMNPSLPRLFACLLAIATGLSAHAGAEERSIAGSGSPTACLHPASWMTLEGSQPRAASSTRILAEMAKQDVVLLGEHHDQEDDHHWQLQALAGLHAHRPDMVLGFEMFPRRIQPVLDRWVRGEMTAKQFLEESEWDKVWSVPAHLYLPLFHFARINRIPMVALNVENSLNKAVMEKGWEQIPESDREGVGKAAPPPEPYRDFLLKIYSQHSTLIGKDGSKPGKDDPGFLRFVESQTTWDRAMAEALASRHSPGKDKNPLLVGIMGSGHIRYGHGVPHQLRALGIRKVGTLLPMGADSECTEIRPGLANAIFALPKAAAAKPEPPRLGVRLEQGEDSVRISEVMTDSLAEKSGLKSGDHLIEVAGLPAKRLMPVMASIRQQPDGSWLPMRVRRGDETLELVVKFPTRP